MLRAFQPVPHNSSSEMRPCRLRARRQMQPPSVARSLRRCAARARAWTRAMSMAPCSMCSRCAEGQRWHTSAMSFVVSDTVMPSPRSHATRQILVSTTILLQLQLRRCCTQHVRVLPLRWLPHVRKFRTLRRCLPRWPRRRRAEAIAMRTQLTAVQLIYATMRPMRYGLGPGLLACNAICRDWCL